MWIDFELATKLHRSGSRQVRGMIYVMQNKPQLEAGVTDCHGRMSVAAGYYGVMVDNTLKNLVRQLPVEDKAELRSILDDELAGYVSPELAARLDARWAEVMANPADYVSIDEDERELRARRRVA